MTRLGKLMRTFVRQTADPLHTPSGETEPVRVNESDAVSYTPELDGRPDPGEVVWAWVPYEEDPSQGKDRPVLVVGREGTTLLALALSSKDHDLDAEDEAHYGRYWLDIGSGAWDREGRPSEVRLDRLLRLEEQGVRREGAVLPRALFDAVIRGARSHHRDL